jgi:hypothetical protein
MSEIETVIVRSKVSNTLYDVVQIDMEADISGYIAREVTFEQAQNILESLFEPLTTVIQSVIATTQPRKQNAKLIPTEQQAQ